MCGSPIAPKNVAMITPYVAATGCAPFVPDVRNGESHGDTDDGAMARLTGTGAPAPKPSRVPAPAEWRHAHSTVRWPRYWRWSSRPVTVTSAGRRSVKDVACGRLTVVALVNTWERSGAKAREWPAANSSTSAGMPMAHSLSQY